MDWQERIALDPKILTGKPIVKGTRLAVEFLIDLLAQGWSEAEILRNYPGLTIEDLAVRSKLPAECGIVLFRIAMPSAAYIAKFVVAAINSRADWTNHFAVVEDDRIRIRCLP